MKTNSAGRDRGGRGAARRTGRSLVEQGFVIAGSPATVAERLIEASRRRCASATCIALLQIGSMPHELTKQNITLFAEEVMPRIRGLWDDEGWEHTSGGRRAPASAVTGGRPRRSAGE